MSEEGSVAAAPVLFGRYGYLHNISRACWDADNGRRLAEMRCAGCHTVAPNQRRDVTDATPFEVIARKFATTPETLAFSLLDPHPRMNVMSTRREAQDIAAYINTLVK